MERNGILLFLKGEGNFILTGLLLLYGQGGWLGTWALHIREIFL